MPLPDIPFDDEVVEFGMPWHGRLVLPAGAANADQYIELASGRRISRPASPFGGDYWDTYLIDHSLPAPTITHPDPEAEFWPVAIRTGSTVWGSIDARNAIKDDGVFVTAEPYFWLSVDGRMISMVVRGYERWIHFDQIGIPAGVPSGIVVDFFEVRVADIARNGRKFIVEFYARPLVSGGPSIVHPNYTIELGEGSEHAGIYAFFEVELGDSVDDITVTPLAGYEECFDGVLISSSDGAPYEWHTASRIVNGDQVTLDFRPYDPMGNYPGLPPACGIGVPEPCRWTTALYSTGTSEATAVRETVVGAWYGPSGDAELIKVRTESKVRGEFRQATLAPGDQYFVSDSTITNQTVGEIQRGNGPWLPFFDCQSVTTKSASGNGYTVTLDGEQVYSSFTPWPGDFTNNDAGGLRNPETAIARGARHNEIWTFAGNSLATVWRIGWRASNKVITTFVRLVDDPGEYCEYFAGPAMTPAGMDQQSMRTGNIWAGCRRPMPDGSPPDPATVRYHMRFQYGSFNPVTGQLLRNQTGGEAYSWV